MRGPCLQKTEKKENSLNLPFLVIITTFKNKQLLLQWDHMEIIGKTIPGKGVREGKYIKRSVG